MENEFTDIHAFADHIDSWYKNQLNVINHFLDVPENVRMEVDDVETFLSGDLHKGFVLGMRLALQDLQSHPPFVVLPDGKPN